MEKTNSPMLSFSVFYRHIINNYCGLFFLLIWKEGSIIRYAEVEVGTTKQVVMQLDFGLSKFLFRTSELCNEFF